ncbi:MAG: M6 family metalloprotease domain-containing protein [Candidatus Thorarchaeota archaeon]
MKQQFSKFVRVVFLIVIIVIPTVQSEVMANNSEVEGNKELEPLVDPVAPASPEIQYSGDPGDAYSPEPELAPTGPQTLIVLLVYFSDLVNKESVPTFNSLIFGNVSDYFQEISYGQCSLSGTVAGWFNLGNSKAYYGADGVTTGATDDVDDDGDNDSWRLVIDALAVADPVIDFSSYSHIMVVHAGNGQESSGVTDDIWSVRWSWPGNFVTDEKTFDSCSIVPETQGGDVDRCIGVIAHEFGHDIGLPDLYHYGKSGADDLVGIWGLMASGSWGGSPSGTKPTHMTAYSKLMLDWYSDGEVYDLVSGALDITLTASSNQTSGLRVIRFKVTDSYYYLVEARYQMGYDSSLSQSGVLVTRVDTSKGSGQGIVQVRSDWIYSLSSGSWTPGEEFVDEVSGFAVEVLSQEDTSFRVRVTSNPLDGWLDERPLSGSGYADYRNPVMATNSLGTLYCAYMVWDTDLGHYTIHVLTSNDGGYSWTFAFGFFSSIMSYINPSMAIDQYDDTIYVAYERTDGLNHNIGLARYLANHSLLAFSTPATDARNPSIAIEYSFGSDNYLMLTYEKWTEELSCVINVDLSTNHGGTWITRSVHSIDTFSLEPEIVVSHGYDGSVRWHLIYVAGNSLSNVTTVVASRSDDYFSNHAGWTYVHSCTISQPTLAAVRGSPEVFYAWTVNMYELTPSYQHDILMWYSSDNGQNIDWQTTLYYTNDDEKYPKLAADSQDYPIYEKGLIYLTYFNGDAVCLRRIYYDRPSVLSAEEVLSTSGYDYPNSIGISTHYVGYPAKRFYAVVSWLNNTSNHEIVCAVPGYYKEFGASVPGYPIIVNGQSYTCPVTLGLMFGYSYNIEIPNYNIITSLERMRFDYWISLPDGSPLPSQNFTLNANRFETGYDLLAVTQYKWTLEYVGDYFYQNSGWVDEGFGGTFSAFEPPLNSTTKYVFSHWSGNVTGTNNLESSLVVATGPIWAYAHWITQYNIIVITDQSSSPSIGWYNKSLIITVSVDDEYVSITVDSRWAFDSWSGNTTGNVFSASEPFLVDGPKTIYASWLLQYLLTVISDYGTSSGAGWYDSGSTAYAGLDSGTIPGGSGIQFIFLSWSGDVSGTNYATSDPIVVDGPKTAIANWQTQYYLTITTIYGIASGEGWYASSTIAYVGLNVGVVPGSPGTRFVFNSWSGDATGSDYSASDSITMDSPKNAIVVWDTEYYLTVTSAHGTSSGEGWYLSDEITFVSLDVGIIPVTNGERLAFQSWTDDASGTNYSQSDEITMDGPKTATAYWDTEYYLTVTTVHGSPSGEGWYSSGSTAYAGLDAGIIPGETGERFEFLSWAGDGSGSNYAATDPISMVGPREVLANWHTQYYLAIVTPYGTSSGEGWYADSSFAYASVNIGIVSGDSGVQYVFDIWSGDATGSTFTLSDSITMDAPKTATALWNTEYYLTVMTAHGTSSGEGWYVAGTTVYAGLDADLVAGATGERFVFQSWTGDASGTDYSQSDDITMDGSKTAAASWDTDYYLTVITAHGTPSGEGWYSSTSTIYVGLNADIVAGATGERFVFQSWTDDATGTDYSQSDPITMDGPKTATVTWQTQYLLTCTTNPIDLSPLPTITPAGTWFNDGVNIILTAEGVTGYVFDHWLVDDIEFDVGVESIPLVMDEAHDAIAYYQVIATATGTEPTTPEPETLPSSPLDGIMILVIIGAGGIGLAVVILIVVIKIRKN